MLTGKGNQYWLTNKYEDKRRKAMVDRTKYSDATLDEVDVLDYLELGGGENNPDTFEIKQFPYPIDQSIRSKKTVDIRDVDPKIGD